MRAARMSDTSPVWKLDMAASARVMVTSVILRIEPRKPSCQFSLASSVQLWSPSTGLNGPVPSAKLPLSAEPAR